MFQLPNEQFNVSFQNIWKSAAIIIILATRLWVQNWSSILLVEFCVYAPGMQIQPWYIGNRACSGTSFNPKGTAPSWLQRVQILLLQTQHTTQVISTCLAQSVKQYLLKRRKIFHLLVHKTKYQTILGSRVSMLQLSHCSERMIILD